MKDHQNKSEEQAQGLPLTETEKYWLFMERRAIKGEAYETAANRLYDLDHLHREPTIGEKIEMEKCVKVLLSFEREFGEEATVAIEDYLHNNRLMDNPPIAIAKERANAGLSNDQKKALRDMGAIRNETQAPNRNRLANFAKQENEPERKEKEPPLLVAGQLAVEGKTIYTFQDLIDTLTLMSANQHPFELYYPNDPRIPTEQDLRTFEDREAVEAIIARDPEFLGDGMRPLNYDDMDDPHTPDMGFDDFER